MAHKGLFIDTKTLSPKSVEKAKIELRETPDIVKQGIDELRTLLENDPKLKYDTSDEFLTIWLRPTKFYAKSAYELLKRAADFHYKYRDVVGNLDPEKTKEFICNSTVFNVLRERDSEGRRILILNVGEAWNPKEVSNEMLFQIVYMMHLVAMLEPETQVNGVVIILNAKGMGMEQVKQFTPTQCMRLVSFIQDSTPFRIKQMHIVNQPTVFNIVWTILKPLLNSKLRNRIFLHGSKIESMHKHINPADLPVDYGGTKPAIDYTSADWYPLVYDHIDFIKKWNDYGLVKRK